VTLVFASGALALSASLSLGTYFSARHLLVEQRERTALRQAFTDAALVRDRLLTPGSEGSEVLGSIAPATGAVMYLHRGDTWYSSSLDRPRQDVTDVVVRTVDAGSAGLAWTDLTDPHAIVVGVPLPAVGASYYEVSVAEELAATLRTLGWALVVCAALTTAGGALLGRAASKRVLQPLGAVAGAAVQVSAGDLKTRLDETTDPDLAVLVGAFNHMVDALHERVERDTRFAADVSHELRTPLTTLTTSLGVLQGVPDLSAGASSAVQLMATELARFRRALEDLLILGRLDAGAGEGETVTVGARELVRQALQASRRPPSLLSTGEGTHEPPVDPLLDVDRRQLLRALINLFQNADLHGGGLTGVAVEAVDDHVEIRVRDEGPGVPAQDRERIFERFARAGGAKEGTGSGLGLSIVARTAANHGGDVWCSDVHGRGGAEFVLRLPRSGASGTAG
jgi:signal transduction histidine kinase